ncbi:MAG: hypothetical protein AB9856_03665 [Cellulosilyticaceae bacterium]
MFDARAYTEWVDCDENTVCKEKDVVTVKPRSGEIIHGEIDQLYGETMTVSSELLGDIDVELSDIDSLEIKQ